jgi:hypothetical protein
MGLSAAIQRSASPWPLASQAPTFPPIAWRSGHCFRRATRPPASSAVCSCLIRLQRGSPSVHARRSRFPGFKRRNWAVFSSKAALACPSPWPAYRPGLRPNLSDGPGARACHPRVVSLSQPLRKLRRRMRFAWLSSAPNTPDCAPWYISPGPCAQGPSNATSASCVRGKIGDKPP